MNINQKLNLVVPLYADDGEAPSGYVHAATITPEAFDAHYLLVAKTFAAIYGEGLGFMAGPRVAAKIMKTVSSSVDDGAGAEALMREIRRMANYVSPGSDPIPLEDAVREKRVSASDAEEVDNALAFFTVASAMHHKSELRTVLNGASRLWGAQTSSSNSTEFAASLRTSTAAATTGGKVPEPQIPH